MTLRDEPFCLILDAPVFANLCRGVGQVSNLCM